jgi:2,4-dienoyl-CoA reductase-like NADH-dependent reductase (Old Yellow Enzyme family)
VFKEPMEEGFKGKPLLDAFTSLPRGPAKVGVAGKLTEASTVQACLEHKADFVLVGRGAILHHDFPMRARDAAFASIERPVTAAYLTTQGVSPPFAKYLECFRGFVEG